MKKYRIRYDEVHNRRIEIEAEDEEHAKLIWTKIITNRNTISELINIDGIQFNYLTEIDENGEDMEGSDWS